jgi:RNA polymerase sigma-70 factor (family 1)
MTEKLDDHILVQLLQKGNVEAFDSLFNVYSPKLFGFALKYLKNEHEAEELVQEVFVKVWEQRQSLKTEFSFKSYLFTIALNRIRKYFNRKAISLRYLENIQNVQVPIFNENLSNDDYDSLLLQIKQIVEQMPPRRREIFLKSKMEGKSAKEIATELKISSGTVDNQVSEALHYIRIRLKKENISILLFAVLFIY